MTKLSVSKFCGASLLAIALSACSVVGPDYQKPTISAPADWSGKRNLVNEAELQKWWGNFQDEELDRLVARAIDGNLDLKMAEQRILAARAGRDVAKAGYYPSLSAAGQAARAQIPSTLINQPGLNHLQFFEAGFDASWEIDLFGKTARTVESADASLEATIEDRRAMLVSLLAEIGEDYTSLRAAQLRRAIALRNIAAAKTIVELARAKQRSGLGNELDLAQAEAQLAVLQAVLPQLETSIGEQSHAIAVLLGLEPAALQAELAEDGTLPPALPSLPATLPSELLRNRPDIRAAERRLAAANAQIGIAEAERYPTLTLSPQVAMAAGHVHQLFESAAALWLASASVKQPLFTGGKLDANQRSAEAATEEARLFYRKTVLGAFQEVEDTLLAYESEQQRHLQLVAAREADRRALDRAVSLYRSGLGNFLAVLDGQRALYAAEDSLAQSDQSLSREMVAMYKALGAGWQAGE